MVGRFDDFDRTLAVMDELRRRMGHLFDDFGPVQGDASLYGESASWPRVNLTDAGAAIELVADVPGLEEKDIEVTIQKDVLTVSGERKTATFDKHTVHRNERRALRFARSFAMPCPIDVEHAEAHVKDGVLTVMLPKAPEAQPRKIAVLGQ